MYMPQPSDFIRRELSEIERKLVDRAIENKRMRISQMALASRAAFADSVDVGWICLQVMTGHELDVEKILCDGDVETFVACHPERKIKVRGREKVVPKRAVIGGYVLVRCAANPLAYLALRRVPHVLGVIGGAMRPMRINDKSVSVFKLKADSGELERLEADHGLRAGDKVFVRAGMFSDFKGTLLAVNGADATIMIGPGKVIMPLAFVEKL